MESLSGSSHRRKHSTAANVFPPSFSFKNPYGDVLLSNRGERKSLQVHEYSEIFSGSSSIPVLDLSGMDEPVGSGDSRSSKIDYTNIFGGLTHDKVFVPHEELLKGSAKKAKIRIPAAGRSYLQESGSRHSSRKSERPPRVTSEQSVDGVKLQESNSLPSTIKTVRPSGVASDQSVDGVKLQESNSLSSTIKIVRPSGVVYDQSVDGVEMQESNSIPSTIKMVRPSGVASNEYVDGVKLQESNPLSSTIKIVRPSAVVYDQSVDGVKLQESDSRHPSRKTEKLSGVASDQSVDGVKLQESDSQHPSRKMEKPSGVASDQPVDGVEQHLSMSFNKTNQRKSDATDVKTHTAKLHAVPGFTHFVDSNRPHEVRNDRPSLPNREVSRTWSFSAEVEPACSKGGSSFKKSQVNDKSHNVNEVNIKSQLSHEPIASSYPSNPSDIKEPRQLSAFDFVSKGDVSQKIAGESSEEFDENAVDAVSATLKKAIEEAQESIRIAKMIMERKKDGQDGSKPRPISSLKVAERETKIEAFGSKDNRTRKKYEELDPVYPVPVGIDGKLTPSPSHSDTPIHAWENVETDRRHVETFLGGCKLFASNHIQSETTHVAENVVVEKLEKKVEAAEEQREDKRFPGCGVVDLEPAEVGNINSLIPSTSELTSNVGRFEMSKETFEWRNVISNHTEGSEVVPELVEGDFRIPQRAQGMEKSLKDDELCQTRFDHAEGPEDNEGKVLNSSLNLFENYKVLDEAGETLWVRQEDGVNRQRENDGNCKEQLEEKLEDCDEMVNACPEFNDMLNASCKLVRNDSLEQEEMEKKSESASKWEGDDRRHANISDEEITGAKQTEGHLRCQNKELLKELLLEVFNKGKLDDLPEVGEFENKVDEAHDPQINGNKDNCADNGDEPKLPEELMQSQIDEEHVNTSKYEVARTVMVEASHCINVQRETLNEAEKMDNTLWGAGRGKDYHNTCQFEEAAYEADINEAVNVSSREASIIFDAAHTNETSNIIAETQESCHVESNSKVEDQKSVKNSQENMPKSIGAVFVIDKDKMAEQLFNLQDDEMLRTNHLHRSASEEIFVENKLHYAYEGLPSDSRTEADFLDTDPEEIPSEDGDVSKTTNDIDDASQEYATKTNMQDIPEVLGTLIRTVELDPADVEQVLEQTTESDEGSFSVSSFEKIDEYSAQETEECAGNVEDTTSNKEELRDEMISDERKYAETLSEELYSHLHNEPKVMEKPLETEETADTDVDMEKDKENLAGMPPMEESDAKEGVQNIESMDQQQRIEVIKRGREREKDRIAVDRAIREARERAFAEVRERAERAAVERAANEVWQRVMAGGREKVEKVSAMKQPVDKASTEAKLKAERAAVERATAEARERALEKARLQKTSEEWRTPTDRHTTERFSSSSRSNALKHSFSSSDLETGTNSESAQRRKARLERHQRIMERAEKALAEKNMRDLLVQKEQAERNRFAESLDADIKRWASGKEGNLRALLSTLQYILGPESGWQPISLTEIITTAAVKKAYRKATLCVHPDKLQQRGASVQQKYICEKVFDLLKAAWNRFNSDER